MGLGSFGLSSTVGHGFGVWVSYSELRMSGLKKASPRELYLSRRVEVSN